jgi:hypothetical protein
MNCDFLFRSVAFSAGILLCLTFTFSSAQAEDSLLGSLGRLISPVQAQDNLPQPDPEFRGKIGETYHDSKADPALFNSSSAPKGAPNILLVLIDDAGYGATSTFGGPASTPTLDKLAKDGLRYTRFHTTALCSPTRAALLTGHNHHSAATGVIMELGTGFPGYTGIMPRSSVTIGQILQNNGYSTAWIGKNHNIPSNMLNNVGPFTHWPNHLGFDYFYGFNGGEADQWHPTIYENLNPAQAWGTPEEGYNLGADQTDKAIAWMKNQRLCHRAVWNSLISYIFNDLVMRQDMS